MSARPPLDVARRRLASHMPELVPTWERLVELADGDETAARMLTLWNPPAFLPGCSQAVLTGDSPVLVRNYDYRPDLCERVIYSSAFTGRRVIGMSDCLWGLVDGMNDAGLAASLAFGGRRGAGRRASGSLWSSAICWRSRETVADVRTLLSGLPVNMAYNITVLDRNADAATIFVAPGERTRMPPVARGHESPWDVPGGSRARPRLPQRPATAGSSALPPAPAGGRTRSSPSSWHRRSTPPRTSRGSERCTPPCTGPRGRGGLRVAHLDLAAEFRLARRKPRGGAGPTRGRR